jgi:hypothetical protein
MNFEPRTWEVTEDKEIGPTEIATAGESVIILTRLSTFVRFSTDNLAAMRILEAKTQAAAVAAAEHSVNLSTSRYRGGVTIPGGHHGARSSFARRAHGRSDSGARDGCQRASDQGLGRRMECIESTSAQLNLSPNARRAERAISAIHLKTERIRGDHS